MTSKSFTTPILFIIFNRPDTTARVFEQIRAVRPTRLFVSADGARPQKAGESDRCLQTRAILKQVDWDCDVQTRFSENNQGCKMGVSSAITWFFGNVEEGIILEDDCCPDTSFFFFCETLLARYRNDQRIMHINGINFQDGKIRGNGTYYFSILNNVWGWATWKRAWGLYDVDMHSFPKIKEGNLILPLFSNSSMRQFWLKKFEIAYNKGVDTWDLQWQYAMSINNGLAIVPNKNLVSNIGFAAEATHTRDSFDSLANRSAERIETILPPAFVVPDPLADSYAFQKYMNPNKFKKFCTLIRRKFFTKTL
ncbi:MAG: hypothetical protein WAV76_14605 [Bacteroidota bacterium]